MTQATHTRSVTPPAWMVSLWSGSGPSELILHGPPDAIGVCQLCFRSSWGRELHASLNLEGRGQSRISLDSGIAPVARADAIDGLRALVAGGARQLRAWLGDVAGWEVWQDLERDVLRDASKALLAGDGATAAELAGSRQIRSSRGLLVAVHLAQLCGDTESAAGQLERLPAIFSSHGTLAGAADTARALGATGHLETLLESLSCLPETPPYDALRLQICRYCRDASALGSGEPHSVEAVLRQLQARGETSAIPLLFQLASWRGSAKDMSATLDTLNASEQLRARALLLLADGQYDEAADALARVVAFSPEDEEARQLQGEALVRGGNPEQALALKVPRPGVGPARTLLSVAMDEPTPLDDPPEILAALGIAEPVTPETALCGLERLGLNRTHTPSWIGDGELQAFRLRTPRQRVIAIQHQVTFRDPETVVHQLGDFAKIEPDNIHVLTYQGELLLWMGDYEGAIALFRQARARYNSRWSYIGEGAALSLLGQDDEALEAWEAFPGLRLPYAAVYCYRGEIWLRRGDLERAREDLEWAASQTHGRLGVWPALGRLAVARNDDELARKAISEIRTLCPALLQTAEQSTGQTTDDLPPTDALFARMLELMRGNRSSHVYSFYDTDGVWRAHDVAPAPAARRLEESIARL